MAIMASKMAYLHLLTGSFGVGFASAVHTSVKCYLLQRQWKYEFGIIDQEWPH
jgi:hypothetical protein